MARITPTEGLPTRFVDDELKILERTVVATAKRYAKGYRLGESDYHEMWAIGMAVGGRAWQRWAWDGDVPLDRWISSQIKWPIRKFCQNRIDERDRTSKVEVASLDLCQAEYAERDPRLARIDQLAVAHQSVAIYIALEFSEDKPKEVAARYLNRRGVAPMAYVDLWAEHAKGQAIVASDPELRRMWSEGWAPAAPSQWDLAVLETPPPAQLPVHVKGLPAEGDRHLHAQQQAHPPATCGSATEVAVLVGAWFAMRLAVGAALAVRLAGLGVRYGPVRYGPARAAPS